MRAGKIKGAKLAIEQLRIANLAPLILSRRGGVPGLGTRTPRFLAGATATPPKRYAFCRGPRRCPRRARAIENERSDPGLRIGDQVADALGELAGDDVVDRDGLEDLALAGPKRDPDVLEGGGRTVVAEVLRALAAHVGQGAVDDADDVGQADLAGRPGQPVAALGAALR